MASDDNDLNYPRWLYFSWQAYMIITFVMMVLGGALASLLGMFHLNRMPTFYHPLFHSENFKRATDDGFFVSIESDDKLYDQKNMQCLYYG